MSKNYEIIKSNSDEAETDQTPSYSSATTSQSSSSTDSILEELIDFVDSSTYLSENLLNRRRLRQFKEKYIKQLLSIIYEQDFEYGLDSAADLFVRGLMEENALVTKEWLNSVFIDYFHDTMVLIALLQVISHLEYPEIHPQGPTMALAALAHANLEVRECGIRAFENWGTIESLSILRNLKCPESWMQDYVNQVILDLEEEFGYNESSS